MSEEEVSYRFRNYSVGIDTSRYKGHTCMTIMENQTLDKKEVLAMQFYDEQAKAIQNIINQLLQENKELKERIERALKYKSNEIYYCLSSGDDITIYLDMLDDILMGVEK